MPNDKLETKAGFVQEKRTGKAQWKHMQDQHARTLHWLRETHWNGWKSWKSAYLLARGDQWSSNTSSTPELTGMIDHSSDKLSEYATVNLIGSHIQNLIPFLVRQAPEFLADPRRPEEINSAKAQAALMNYFWTSLDMTEQLKLATDDFATIGNGFVRTGYKLLIDKVDPDPAKSGAVELTPVDYIRDDAPFIRRVNPFQLLIDPQAKHLSEARWVTEVIFRPWQDVIEDTTYDPSVLKLIKNPQKGQEQPVTMDAFEQENHNEGDRDAWMKPEQADEISPDYKHQNIVLFERWDKRQRKYYVFAAGISKPLIEKDWPYPYLAGFPFVHFKLIRVPNELYGVGHSKSAEFSQKAINRVRSKQMAMMRAYTPKWQGPKLDADDKNALKDGSQTYVNLPATDSRAIDQIPVPRLPEDTYRLEDALQNDFRTITGQDALLSGGLLPSRTSAQEVKTRERLAGLKIEDNVDSIDRAVLEIGRQLNKHIKANLTKTVAVKILGPVGEELKVVSNEDIQAEVDISIISSNKEPEDKATKKQQALEMFQVLAQGLPTILQLVQPAQMLGIDLGALLRFVMEQYDLPENVLINPALGVPAQIPDFSQIGRPQEAQPGQAPPDPAAQQINAEGRQSESDSANPLGVQF